MKQIMAAGKIGNMELKNRLTMAPMGLHLGELNEAAAEFYKTRIRGGVSLIQINCMVTGELEDTSASMLIEDKDIPALKELCDFAHEYDCKVALQLMLGCGRVGGPSAKYGGLPIAASPGPWHHYAEMICQEITTEDVHMLESEYRNTLKRGLIAGIDAVEVHAYGGYLVDQFLTEKWNQRTDEYGGSSVKERMTLLRNLVNIAREEGGEDLAILVKYTPDHYIDEEGYRKIDEGIEIARELEALGVDALHVCAGCYDNWENAMPPVYFQGMTPHILSAEKIKENVSIPVMVHGRLGNPAKAEAVLEKGHADFLAVGRGVLAEPDLANKIADGDILDIRPCISCDEGCINQVFLGQRCTCAVNPFCGYETERIIPETTIRKKVLIIGAGPGGATAAILAAEAGHDVEIWEKNTRIGGNALVASMPANKRDMESLIRYYEHKLPAAGVRVKLMKEATTEAIADYAPDHVIWAAGGIPLRPASIPGIDRVNVITAADALKNLDTVGEKIAVIGGGLVGCETATHFALMGKDVSVVEMAPAILPEQIFPQVKNCVISWMEKSGLKKYEGTKLVSIDEGCITVEKNGTNEAIKCDTVILAMGFKPNLEVISEIEKICPVTSIGDSVKLGRIMNATADAYNAVAGL